MFVIAALFLVALPLQADVRARVAEQDEANRVALATITFPGFDTSDEATRAAAVHYCGKADECAWSFIEARNRFIRTAALERRQKQALKILTLASDDVAADWRFAETLYQAKYHPARRELPAAVTSSCSTSINRNTITSTCSVY